MTASSESRLPPYARVVADIRERILSGQLEPGDRVPSTREITREWGVAMATATKALAALRGEGLVDSVRGVGTVVREIRGDGPTEAPAPSRERRPTRSDAPLDRQVVVDAAIAVADAEGIEALSMRRVATELRVSTMALYRHVDGKDELAAAMIDKIYHEGALPEPPPARWRDALELAVRWEWGVYRKHPWAVSLTPMSGPVLSPALMANAEWMMKIVVEQGHSSDTALEIVTILSAFTSGMALQAGQAVVEEHELGLGAEHWWKSRSSEFERYAEEGAYPVMFGVSGLPDVERIFTLGLERLLDGLEPLVAERSTSTNRARMS